MTNLVVILVAMIVMFPVALLSVFLLFTAAIAVNDGDTWRDSTYQPMVLLTNPKTDPTRVAKAPVITPARDLPDAA